MLNKKTDLNSHKLFPFLKERMRRPLPGSSAHLQMAPEALDGTTGFRFETVGQASESSVMIILYAADEEVETVLTVRNQSIVHGGQISFPGGQSDPGETPVETALREMQEEIGVRQDEISVLGTLTRLYVDRSRSMITPVVGLHPGRPRVRINPEEVQEAFAVSLNDLMNEEYLVKEPWTLRELTYNVPYWKVHQIPLWGATAMILSELLVLYREYQGR